MATTTTTIKVTADTRDAQRALGDLQTTLGRLASIAAISALAKQFADLSDASTNLQNKLRLVAQEGQSSSDLFNVMVKSANALGAPLQDVGDLFFRIANNTKDLGLAQTTQLRITDLMMKGFMATGASMNEARGAVVQFGQALSVGTLRGDELNSILEGAPVIADAIAAKFGVVRGALKVLGEQGKISSKDVIDAMLAAGQSIDDAFATRIPTINNSFNVFKNTISKLTSDFDQQTGAGMALSYAILIITDAVISVYEWFMKWGRVIGYVIEAVLLFLVPVRGALFILTRLGAVVEFLIGPFIALFKAVGQAGGAFAQFLAGIGAGGLAGIIMKSFDGIRDLFGNDNATMADNYNKKLEEINKRLGLDNVEASKAAQAASGATTAQQLKDAEAVRKANQERLESLRDILKAQADAISLTQYEGTELKIQEAIYAANKQLVKEIKNDKGEIIGYTSALSTEEEKILRSLTLQAIQATLQRDITADLKKANDDLMFAKTGMYSLTGQQLDVELKILDLERQYGAALNDDLKAKIRGTQESQKQLEYIKQIRSALDATKPLQGAAAGASAAGQLSALDPVNAAMTANQTLFNGLKYLRDQDLISEQQYQTARLNATLQAQQAIYDANKKQFETSEFFRIQKLTGEKFSFETQKQMAADSAAFQMKSDMEKAQFGIEQAASVFSSLGQQNKKAFEASKALNIAMAIMNTYMGATKALATYPWPFGMIAAVAAVAAGMAQVAQIRSQSYSGRALGGPVMKDKPYIVGERGPELFTPNTSGSITPNNQLNGAQNVTVNFNITANDASGFDSLLLQRRGLITNMIADAQLERGRRA